MREARLRRSPWQLQPLSRRATGPLGSERSRSSAGNRQPFSGTSEAWVDARDI